MVEIRRLVTRKSGKEICGWKSQNEHHVKILTSHVSSRHGYPLQRRLVIIRLMK